MAISWSGRRQLLYYAVSGILLLAVLMVAWQALFTAVPTCLDGVQNQDEGGVDCGGSCALLCRNEAQEPVVLWQRSFQSGPSTYAAVAYVQNRNPGAGAKSMRYSFSLLDENNILVQERQGVIDLPPTQIIPIIETGIEVGNRTPARTLFTFSDRPVWNRIPQGAAAGLRVSAAPPERNGSRLSGTITNASVEEARNVTVAAVLFDAQGVARAASKTLIARLPRKTSQNITFTWAQENPSAVRAELTVLPSL